VAPTLGLPLGGAAPHNLAVHVVLAALALACGLLPRWYEQRAALMLLIGLGCGGLGVIGIGPAAAAREVAGEWGLLALLTATGLPAALLFRAHYRAFRAARLVLGGALALSVPFAVHGLLRAVGVSDLALQIANGVAVGSVFASLLGFMGSETTGAGTPLAALVTAAMAGVLGTETLVDPGGLRPMGEALGPLVSIGAFAAGALLAALGLFGLLAWRLGPQARTVDPRPHHSAEKPARPSLGGWLSRR
jgi:hypothetical protein